MATVLIGLGANILNPTLQLARALSALDQQTDIAVWAVSRVYRSAPLGPLDQPDFFNAAVKIETSLPPEALLSTIKMIELQQGRVASRRWGERCIDLDILLYDALELETDTLHIPHPGICERAFVLDPLIDLLGGEFKMPSGAEIGKLRDLCPDSDIRVEEFELAIPSSAEN